MPVAPRAVVIDASRRLLHPGLVNAHTHGHGNLSRSMGDRFTLELLLAAAPHMSPYAGVEEKRVSATIGAAEMLLKGCTACYDLFVEFPLPTEEGIAAVHEAYVQAGVRRRHRTDDGRYDIVRGDPWPDGHTAPATAERGGAARVAAMAGDDRTDAVHPASMARRPNDGAARCGADNTAALSRRVHGCLPRPGGGVRMSAFTPIWRKSKIQAVAGARRYGGSLTTHIEQLGLLGPRFVAAHGVWLDGDDMRRLGAHGASIAHNPASNMRLGNGVADAVGMLEAGVNLAIGTDAATCNDNLNMYQSLHFAAAASHARGPDPARWITAPQVFAAATTGSARALGFERIGRIAPGYAADIVFLDLDAPTLIPLNEPTTQMVMGEDGTSVVDVMVAGRFVVRGPPSCDGDLPALAARAAELRADIDARSVASRTRFDAIAPILCDFCPALAGRSGTSIDGAAAPNVGRQLLGFRSREMLLSPHSDHHGPPGDVDPCLDPLDELRRGIADQEIDHCHHCEDLEVLVGGRCKQLPAEHQVAHGDHGDQCGILEDGHEEVAK